MLQDLLDRPEDVFTTCDAATPTTAREITSVSLRAEIDRLRWPAYRDPDTEAYEAVVGKRPARHSPPLKDNQPPLPRSCDASTRAGTDAMVLLPGTQHLDRGHFDICCRC